MGPVSQWRLVSIPKVVCLKSLPVFELPPLDLAHCIPVGPSDPLPKWALSGEGCSLLTSKLKTLGGLACGDGVRGFVFYYYLLFLLF